jgi:superfamily II DNA or RNA helicase
MVENNLNNKLRGYQQIAVKHCVEALYKYGNTLLIAPTGSGKTRMLSHVINEFTANKSKVLILQHRSEILQQNIKELNSNFPDYDISIYNSTVKCLKNDIVFASVQTLIKPNNLAKIVDQNWKLIVIDEVHHIRANSYIKIISLLRKESPGLFIFGVTATPSRSDKKRLSKLFSNVGRVVQTATLIEKGYLVRPSLHLIDIGLTQGTLQYLKEHKGGLAQSRLDSYVNNVLLEKENSVFSKMLIEWEKLAKGRQTVIFTPTNSVSNKLSAFLTKNNYKSCIVDCNTSTKDRQSLIKKYETGDYQFIINSFTLTEGWDSPKTSCIVLLKSSSYIGMFIQMIGRGLRIAANKENCLVLDFGVSSSLHGDITRDFTIKDYTGDLYKKCPDCKIIIPGELLVCPICGYGFQSIDGLQCPFDVIKRYLDPYEYEIYEISKQIYFVYAEDCMAIIYRISEDLYLSCGFTKEDVIVRTCEFSETIEDAFDVIRDFILDWSECAYYIKDRSNFKQAANSRQLSEARKRGLNIDNLTWYQAACVIYYDIYKDYFLGVMEEKRNHSNNTFIRNLQEETGG